MMSARPRRWERQPPYKAAGALLVALVTAVVVIIYIQSRGGFTSNVPLTMLTGRAGLDMEPGAKVTLNGAPIGRVSAIAAVTDTRTPIAKLTLAIDPKYLAMIPANVTATIDATTVFGSKRVSLTSPANPTHQWITTADVIDATAVTTELNTLFETILSVAQKADPIKLNATLTATAQALDGSGARFGQAIANGNDILADINARMPQLRQDTQRLADLADVFADSAPDLVEFLQNAVTTAHTLNGQQTDLDAVLLASIGFGNAGGDTFERGGPYLLRGIADAIPTAGLLAEYSPEFFCAIRNFHDAAPKIAAAYDNGYSIKDYSELAGAGNPYVYPDNLPRVNAHGGPEGRPGCWAPITRDLWPAPYLVMDSGASNAPYNHFALGQPSLMEYVWGRQVGEHTINP